MFPFVRVSRQKSFLGCKTTRQSVILGDWQDPLEQNFELQTIFSQLSTVRASIPKLLYSDYNIPQSHNLVTVPPDVPLIPSPPPPINESCINLLSAIDSISAAREEQRKF